MNIYISADIEGVSGVVHPQQGRIGEREYDRARRLMTEEVNAAILGAIQAGAKRIVVNDAHGPMRNLLIEELHASDSVELITGTPKPYSMVQGLDGSFDRAFFVGYHSRAGTQASTLDHTFSGSVFRVWLNDTEVGEVGLNAALAGYYGVPVALVTGDQRVTEEARALLGDELITVAVKEGYSRYAARCLVPEEARRRIRQAAERACLTSIQPWRLEAPVHLAVEFTTSGYADMAELIPGSQRVDARRIEFTHEDYLVVYRAFRAMVALASLVDR
ncbi:MAG TPA: M55 family metallopeptidase [Caldilineae bacterium]|nr:M55 family metallopeptidase [Caldilineae bacterium]